MLYKRLKSLLFILITCATLVIVACPDSNPELSSTNTSNTPSFTFNIPSFTIRFNLNKGTDDILPIRVSKGNTVTKPKTPTKDNHTFGGWYLDSECKIPFFFTTKIIKNLTLYARWNTLNRYTVRFNTNGGDVIPQKDIEQTIVSGGIATVPPTPSKTDASFGGWYMDSVSNIPFFFTTKITKNLTLYAGWNTLDHYTVRFNTNGGTIIPEQIVASGNTATKPKNDLTPEGARLVGWYKDVDLTKEFNFGTAITQNTTLYAGWNLTVTFYTNSGSFVPEQSIPSGTKVDRPEPPKKDGYVFVDWYTDENLSKAFNFGTAITEPITLYAGWGHIVRFSFNNGIVIADKKVLDGRIVSKPRALAKEDYAFFIWYTDVELTKEFNFDTAITQNTTLYASRNFTVTFDTDSDSVVPEQSIPSGTKVARPEPPKKDDYTFTGWYANGKFNKEFNFDTDKVYRDTTLYASWNTLHHYIVRFINSDGTAIANKKVLTWRKVTKPPDPTKDGYIFFDWYMDVEFTKKFDFNTAITKNITLYAGWKAVVTFNTNGGSFVSKQSIPSGTKVARPEPPKKDDYVFVDWYTDGKLSKAFNFGTAITEPITLYAGWGHTVRFNTNDGTAIANKKVLTWRKVTKPPDPTKDGYGFVDWYTDGKLSKVFSFDTAITKNTTLYARWNLTVIFNTNGGSFVPQQSISSGTEIARPEPPEKDDYVFVDWYTDGKLSKVFNFGTAITEPITLYAGWGHIVRFSTNDGTAIADKKVLTWRKVTKPPDPTKDGYGFVDWYTDGKLSKVFNFDTAITKNIILYAFWNLTATFNTNGGSVVPQQSISSGTKVTRPDPPTKDGYGFVDWYTDVRLSKAFNFGTAITEPITLYAGWGHIVRFSFNNGIVIAEKKVLDGCIVRKPRDLMREDYPFFIWYTDVELTKKFNFDTAITQNTILYASRNFTVIFDTDSDSVVPEQSIPSGTKVARPDPPKKDGYIFTGWYADCNSLKIFNFDTDKIYRDTTLYAGWNTLRYYTVRFNDNDGTTIADKQVLTWRKVTKPPDPMKDGYIFFDWYMDVEFTKKFDFNTKITKNITLYAGWKAVVTFNLNGGTSTSIVDKKVLFGRKVPVPKDAPTKDGYVFYAWYIDPTFSKPFDFNTAIIEPITLYAGWGYTVRFDTGGGTAIADKKVLTWRKVTKPLDPTKDGHVFVGWYEDKKLTKVFNFTSETVTKDLTLYASWASQ